MASTSTNTKHSRFSTFKVFKFSGSKPPPPPPKDTNYIYSTSVNPSLVSFNSPQSAHGKPSTCSTLSVRSPCPALSRAIQQSPPASVSMSAPSSDQNPSPGKRGFFRKISGLRKRSASKSSRVTNPDDTTDDEAISRPWNFQVRKLRFSPFGARHGLDPFSRLFSFFTRSHAMSDNYTITRTRTHPHVRSFSIIYT
jgi:hypothetical protein